MVEPPPATGRSTKVRPQCRKIMHNVDSFARMAELHAAKYAKQFSRVMWQQCGMRLIVLEAHHDTKGELCIAS
jgi:hypothetical protein